MALHGGQILYLRFKIFTDALTVQGGDHRALDSNFAKQIKPLSSRRSFADARTRWDLALHKNEPLIHIVKLRDVDFVATLGGGLHGYALMSQSLSHILAELSSRRRELGRQVTRTIRQFICITDLPSSRLYELEVRPDIDQHKLCADRHQAKVSNS